MTRLLLIILALLWASPSHAIPTCQANASAPSLQEGQQVPCSMDLSGNVRTSGTISTGSLATSANQTNASQKTQVVDGSGNVIGSTSNALNAYITGGTAQGYAQGSTTNGQLGGLTQCAVTTSAPSYTTGQTSPCSLTTNGAMRLDFTSCSGCSLDGATFTAGTSSSSVLGGAYWSSIPNLTSGQSGAAAMSIDRGVYQSVKNSGKPAGLIGCDKTVVINTAASGTATIIAISGSTAIYVCGWEIMSSSASATNVNLSYGTGANCGTGTTVMSPLVRFPAGVTGLQGKVTYSPFWSGMNAQPGNGICIVNSAAVQIDGIVYYTQF